MGIKNINKGKDMRKLKVIEFLVKNKKGIGFWSTLAFLFVIQLQIVFCFQLIKKVYNGIENTVSTRNIEK